MKVKIEKVFVVNLDDRVHRWNLFKNLKDSKIERISAVDTRKNWFKYREYGLELIPYGKSTDHYFTQSKGAVGCYLSHYTIWKKIIDRSYEWCLILEDDADVTQFKNYVASNYNVNVKQDVDVVQLNKRTQHGNLEEYFNGTTSYLINKRAAKILLDSTHDFSHLNQCPDDVLKWRVDTLNLHSCPELLRDVVPCKYCWTTKNAIRLAVDKFIGYNGFASLPNNKRLKLDFDPQIAIHESLIESDVTDPSDTYYWDMNCLQLKELELRDDFMWWAK